jgi:hypothetical protein
MLTGQCLCGAVRYTFTGTPQLVFLFHCRDCQRSGGSLAHFGVWVPEAGFSRTGEVRSYTNSSESGRKITREFCPICGSGIDNRLEVAPGVVVIKGGTLDNPAAAAPVCAVQAACSRFWRAPEKLRGRPNVQSQ